ncbi:MAG: molybdopterin molybdotransferase MoeA [Verrucomicrobiales bacterium]|nr:molybdopterin molybdotransferase MoeA [Verrucomicrobiales bacterium]
MLEESEALQRILEPVEPGAVIWVPVELALDQILAQDIAGVIDSPPFDNSSMDGYAVRAAESATGMTLELALSEQAAGVDLRLKLNPGEAIRIFTGAPIPEGADAVIMQEDVEREGGAIAVTDGVVAGENIRRRGGDVCSGQKLLNRGDLITPARVGLLASQGIAEVPVHVRPLVQIVTTGDELVEPGAPLVPGEIYNSNGPMLQASVQSAGGVVALSHASDDRAVLEDTLRRAFATSDLVVIAGGVSVGERDYVKEVLNELGVITDFWRVKMKPGKPFLYGHHPDGTPVFGLPGNPVSAFVTFTLFVKPVIRALLGHGDRCLNESRVKGIAGTAMSNQGERPHYLRGIFEAGKIRLSGTQQSHAIFGLSQANCLVRLDPGQLVEVGDPVEGVMI